MLRSNRDDKRWEIVAAILASVFMAGISWADAPWKEQAKLTAADGSAYDCFGESVSNSGDYVIVGTPYDDDTGSDAGSAYIFKFDGSEWRQQAKIRASEGTADDRFGYSVCISGDYAIVGAPYDDVRGDDSGSAYIFKRRGTSWIQQAKLTASDGSAYDEFGYSVSISGDWAIVGVHYADGRGDASGSAYIFRRSGTNWVQQTKLTASDGLAYDEFGYSVAINGDWAIVGAIRGDSDTNDCGCAYIFKLNGTAWMQQAKLVASDAAAEDNFGSSVAIDKDIAIVGAIFDDPNGTSSGSAYIFRRNDTSWVEETKLVASDSDAFDEFGKSVSISGDYAVVGAHYENAKGGLAGAVYVFEYDGMGWPEEAKLLASDGSSRDRFGGSVSISGDFITVGASYNSDMGTNSGSAYVFRKACPSADLSADCAVDFVDFALISPHWLETGCNLANWCSGADIDHSSNVNWVDFVTFGRQWKRIGCVGPGWCNGADIDHSGKIDLVDLSVVAARWLDRNCDQRWCNGVDLNKSSDVGLEDLSIFAEQWLQGGQ